MHQEELGECNCFHLLVDPHNWVRQYGTNCVFYQTRTGKLGPVLLNKKLYVITNSCPTSELIRIMIFTSIDRSRQGLTGILIYYNRKRNRPSWLEPRVCSALWMILALNTRRLQALGLFKNNSRTSTDKIAGAMSTAGYNFYVKLQHALRVQVLIILNGYVKKDEYLSSCSQSKAQVN